METYKETGRRLQAAYTKKMRDAGHVFTPLTADELAKWKSGLHMAGFAHIVMDGDVVLGEKS